MVSEVYEALILGLHDYVKKNGFQKTVIGISGGIDSAIVLLSVEALGADNVVVYLCFRLHLIRVNDRCPGTRPESWFYID